jgi:hypothetical protein
MPRVFVVMFVLLLGTLVAPLHAQTPSGEISGVVTLSGPVVLPKINGRDRLFFLFNWEGLRESTRRERRPDPHLRSGDTRLRR